MMRRMNGGETLGLDVRHKWLIERHLRGSIPDQ